ncbi:aminotransferase class V-fold PLP-dependent enzyme [archaeon]|jgi:cystathionine beta-lyase/cystathionine gamma-synthase|nr:aminotransferase class V-fold PLP-dependent enzyme [archaeon]
MKDAVLKELRHLTKHENVAVINRGNAAILLTMLQSTGPILIPKEGGWMTYEKFAVALNRELIKVDTKQAKIDLEDLKRKITAAKKNCKENEQVLFIYHSNAAYTIAQDTKEIYNICHSSDVLVAMDACGSIGTELANGHHCDIMFSSFGKWKLIDANEGAFISTQNKDLFQKVKPLVAAVSFDGNFSLIHQKIKDLPNRIEFLRNKSQEIIQDLSKFQILNKSQKFPFVVLVKFKNEIERLNIAAYCTKNELEYTVCPREIRIMEDAISIEVKRLES